MLKNILATLSFLAIVSMLVCCTSPKTQSGYHGKPVISHDEFVQVLADIHLAQQIAHSEKFRTTYPKLDSLNVIDEVLKKHDVTRKAYDSTMNYYIVHGEDFYNLYEEVITELSSREQKDKIEYGKAKAKQDSINNKK
jgi:hypothetical protein